MLLYATTKAKKYGGVYHYIIVFRLILAGFKLNIVKYDRWGFTADYTDFTIGAKYWMAENGHFCAELYVNGNLIRGSEYDLTAKHGVAGVTEPWNFGVFFCEETSVNQTATFSEFKVQQLEGEPEKKVPNNGASFFCIAISN